MKPVQAFTAGGLTDSIVAFAQFAREQGMNVGIQETQDALQAADAGLLSVRADMRSALKALFCHSPEDCRLFEKIFTAFWDTNPLDLRETPNQTSILGQVTNRSNASVLLSGSNSRREAEEEEGKTVTGAHAAERLKHTDLASVSVEEWPLLERLAQQLFRDMMLRQRRRLRRQSVRGLLDLRRTIRGSLAYGGDPMKPAYRERLPKKQRLVVLLDVSGSMDTYSWMLLRFVSLLKPYFRQLEVFVFSTSLIRITRALALRRVDDLMAQVAHQVPVWSGGTRIGECLERFISDFGGRMLNGSPVVIILSDGLDTGEAGQVEEAVKSIRRRARRVVWLNPLKGMRGYAPLARGMREAMPHIDEFGSARDLKSLLELEQILWHA